MLGTSVISVGYIGHSVGHISIGYINQVSSMTLPSTSSGWRLPTFVARTGIFPSVHFQGCLPSRLASPDEYVSLPRRISPPRWTIMSSPCQTIMSPHLAGRLCLLASPDDYVSSRRRTTISPCVAGRLYLLASPDDYISLRCRTT